MDLSNNEKTKMANNVGYLKKEIMICKHVRKRAS
jgi:hypothetical protein